MQISMKLKREDIQSISEQLQSKRRLLHMNYSDIARVSGVDQGQVSRICRGQFKTRSANVMQISKTLGVIITGDDEAPEAVRLRQAVMELWDGTSADADRITRLLSAVGDVRKSSSAGRA